MSWVGDIWRSIRGAPAEESLSDPLKDAETERKRKRLPEKEPMKDLPITTIAGWDDIDRVKSALEQLEQGRFSEAAMLCDFMGRDDRINAVMSQRVMSLLGQPMHMETEEEGEDQTPASQEAADWFEANYGVMVPEDQAQEFLKWGLYLGVALAEITWKVDKGQWTPIIRVYHPRHVYWRWDTRSYWITLIDGTEEITPGDGRWILYTPKGYQRGWMGGLVRSLALPFLIRQFTYRDWGRFSEVYGSPIRGGIVPPNATTEQKKRFVKELAAMGKDGVVLLEQTGPNESGFDLKLIEATATNWQAFDKLIEKAEDSIQIAVLGQTLTTGAKSGGLGSGGVAQVHEKVRDDLLKADANTFGQCLKTQLFSLAAGYNFGDPELAPTPCWEIDPPEDMGEKANTINVLGQGLTALKGSGVPVDVEAIAEEFQIPLLSPEEHAKQIADETQNMVDRAKAMAEAMPEASPDPGGKGGPPPRPSPGSGGSTKASAIDKPKGFVRGQMYTDALVDASQKHGAGAIKGDLEMILAIVQSSKDYEELRAKIQLAYKHMNPESLGDILHKAIILAELNGRDAVIEDV